jgi:hypothetical protein
MMGSPHIITLYVQTGHHVSTSAQTNAGVQIDILWVVAGKGMIVRINIFPVDGRAPGSGQGQTHSGPILAPDATLGLSAPNEGCGSTKPHNGTEATRAGVSRPKGN